jgi:hypothetical protein
MLFYIFVYASNLGWKDFTGTERRYVLYPLKSEICGDNESTFFSVEKLNAGWRNPDRKHYDTIRYSNKQQFSNFKWHV